MNLKEKLKRINVAADWIGLREVNEKSTYRVIRDMKPQANESDESHGIMVEVLYNGQFGYYGSNSTDVSSLQIAAEKALEQAKIASKYSIHSFSKEARPKANGNYISTFKKYYVSFINIT